MPVKKIVEYHINRLKDKNAELRIKAIKELELLADPDSLQALQDVFESDDNADVRKAAQKAGRTVFLKNNDASENNVS